MYMCVCTVDHPRSKAQARPNAIQQRSSTFSDSRTTFEILSRFADHQGRDEKIPFLRQKYPMTLLVPPKSLNFLNISYFLHFLNMLRYTIQFFLRNFQCNDLFKAN